MISLRKYNPSDFEKSVKIREIKGEESRERWRGRIERSGSWDDHYFHLAIDLDGELVGDLQVRHCQQAMPPGALELGLEIDPAKQGQGIGTEVLKLAAKKFFADGIDSKILLMSARSSVSTRNVESAILKNS